MLKLKNINRKLGAFALSGINLHIREGEYFVLLGRSGSGKTQLLELIAGLNRPDSGEVWINGINVTKKRIRDHMTGLVFQDYAIFPNMTVFGNIAYSLHSGKLKKSGVEEKVNAIAEEMNIRHLLRRSTHNLSVGELQRVALARTLIVSPKLLLLDEPMASVDASIKDDIRRTLRNLNRKGLTIIHVTHDFREAVSLASRVGVIHNGHIIQEGHPDNVFRKPVNRFVARYAGIKNFFRIRIYHDNGTWKGRTDKDLVFTLSGNSFPPCGLLIIRNDSIKIHKSVPLPGVDNCFRGVVNEIIPSGYGMDITVKAGDLFYIEVARDEFKSLELKETDNVWISFSPESGIVLEGPGG